MTGTAKNLAALQRQYPGAETFTLGDSAKLNAHLLSLIRSGAKTASCGAYRDFAEGEPMPVVGRRDIALDWNGAPALVIETCEVVCCTFEEITSDMALAEGENDSLAGWRRDHQAFFERDGGFSPDMQIVWERFSLIESVE